MKVTFLEADRPLVKSYSMVNGVLRKESYPNAYEFTSHTFDVETIQHLYELMLDAASRGWCLLKGELQRELVRESRAGSTNNETETSLVCLDYDQMARGQTIDESLMRFGLGNLTYILQYSASHGVEPEKGGTGHAFFMLEQGMFPDQLKNWLMFQNLTRPELSDQMALSRTGNALKWPLDITTCQNDKLIYIAPPTMGPGVECTHQGPRIQLVARERQRAAVLMFHTTWPPARIEEEKKVKLDQLRARAGYPVRQWGSKETKDGIPYLAAPGEASITGRRSERGFTYFNLNGGDSWGYYHPDNSPEIIRNFKGEPFYLTKELLPAYWSSLQLERKEAAAAKREVKESLERGDFDVTKKQLLVFREANTSAYYSAEWWPEEQRLEVLRISTLVQVQHLLIERGMPEIDAVPTWKLAFDPFNNERINPDTREINMFRPTQYMLMDKEEGHTLEECPVIRKVLLHVWGEEMFSHVLNWIACIWQFRSSTNTALAAQGIQGTGKGIFINKILVPLFGLSNVVTKRMEELEDKFNEWAKFALIVAIDEAQISSSHKAKMIMANLKNMITEDQISIRAMRAISEVVPNFTNWIFLSNQPDPVTLDATDRRFNVGHYQLLPLVITDEEIEAIKAELPAFAHILSCHKADQAAARKIVQTEARDIMQATGSNSIELTANAIRRGDLAFFWEALPAGDIANLPHEQLSNLDNYKRLVHAAVRSENGVQRMTRDELRVLFAFNVGEVPKTPTKFTQMMRHHRINIGVINYNGLTVRGIDINWKMEPAWRLEKLREMNQGVTPLRAV